MIKSCKYEKDYCQRTGCCCENCRIGTEANKEQYMRMTLLETMWQDNLTVVIKKHKYHPFLMVKKFLFEVKEIPSSNIRSSELVEI